MLIFLKPFSDTLQIQVINSDPGSPQCYGSRRIWYRNTDFSPGTGFCCDSALVSCLFRLTISDMLPKWWLQYPENQLFAIYFQGPNVRPVSSPAALSRVPAPPVSIPTRPPATVLPRSRPDSAGPKSPLRTEHENVGGRSDNAKTANGGSHKILSRTGVVSTQGENVGTTTVCETAKTVERRVMVVAPWRKQHQTIPASGPEEAGQEGGEEADKSGQDIYEFSGKVPILTLHILIYFIASLWWYGTVR